MSVEAQAKPRLKPAHTLYKETLAILSSQFGRMCAQGQGVREGVDPAYVQGMRVAIRRMRVGFRVYAVSFSKAQIRPFQQGLKHIAQQLGPVRDLDVFLEKTARWGEENPLDFPAVAPLVQWWTAQRITAHREVVAFLDGGEYHAFLEGFHAFLQTPASHVQKYKRQVPLHVGASGLALAQMRAVLAFEGRLAPASFETLHQLRIAFKRLRYTLEFFRKGLPPEVDEAIYQIRGIQDHLGDLNDARVIVEHLTGLAERSFEPPGLARAIETCRVVRLAERERLQAGFPPVWAAFTAQAAVLDLRAPPR